MAPLLEDPRIRQTWNQISQNAESATETAAAGIWTFQHTYITPCLTTVGESFRQCTGHCLPERDERARRLRERGRAERSFDFYDDWDEDEGLEGSGLLGGWGSDELDRLLAGSGSHGGAGDAPRRKRGMSYGTRGRHMGLDPDPTVIPNTNALGFLGRLPFKLGGTLRYKPSAADLQEHPNRLRGESHMEGEPLISDSGDEQPKGKGHARKRSSTVSSGDTSDSFRSRGDLFPSDEEDAVPIDDEFAMVLERRMTDDRSSGKTRSSKGKRSASERNLSRATQSPPSLSDKRTNSGSIQRFSGTSTPELTMAELREEEERVQLEEDAEVARKREAAVQLAKERGLQSEVESKERANGVDDVERPDPSPDDSAMARKEGQDFVPARLPRFG